MYCNKLLMFLLKKMGISMAYEYFIHLENRVVVLQRSIMLILNKYFLLSPSFKAVPYFSWTAV